MKILVCDDHALFREGVQHALREIEPGVALLEAADGAEVVTLARGHPDLDLVLLDLEMPGTDGWAGLERLRSECPALPVVILSASESEQAAHRALAMGAAGYVPKSTRAPVLVAALKLVLAGGVYLPPGLQPGAAPERLAASAASARRGRADALTERQREVLQMMARGLTNAEIARVLGLALGTVKAHVAAIFSELDVSNRTEAALVMRELGLDQEK